MYSMLHAHRGHPFLDAVRAMTRDSPVDRIVNPLPLPGRLGMLRLSMSSTPPLGSVGCLVLMSRLGCRMPLANA